MTTLTPTQEKELHEAFNIFDIDHSGKISRSELRQVLNALRIKATSNELEKLMNQMDTDGSGDIDFNEFTKVMAQVYFKKHPKSVLLETFKTFDTDGNGFITTTELDTILTRLGRHLTKNELQSIIKSCDTSGDGKLSFEEFCQLFE